MLFLQVILSNLIPLATAKKVEIHEPDCAFSVPFRQFFLDIRMHYIKPNLNPSIIPHYLPICDAVRVTKHYAMELFHSFKKNVQISSTVDIFANT